MLKQLNGFWYMTGTSEDSLYPVVLRDEDSGLRIGLRIDLQKNPNNENQAMFVFYARAQMFDDAGKDRVLEWEPLVKALKGAEIRLTSKFHASGPIAQGMIMGLENQIDHATKAVVGAYVDLIHKIAGQNDLTVLTKESLEQIAKDRFLVLTGNAPVVTEAEVEQKLDAKFDFTKMLKKDGPSAD